MPSFHKYVYVIPRSVAIGLGSVAIGLSNAKPRNGAKSKDRYIGMRHVHLRFARQSDAEE